jgi:hypothetical protein
LAIIDRLRTERYSPGGAAPAARQRSEQTFTFSQSRSHFFRHANGRRHAAQIFVGRLGFLCAMDRQRVARRRGAARITQADPAAHREGAKSGHSDCRLQALQADVRIGSTDLGSADRRAIDLVP